MQEDNIYVNGSQHLMDEPVEQKEERAKEQNEVFSELPIIAKVIKSLEESIQFYNSNDGISDDVLTTPAVFMHVVQGNKQAVAILRAEKMKLESLVREHADPV